MICRDARLFDMAESLTEAFAQHSVEQLHLAAAERQRVLAAVPDITTLVLTRRVQRRLLCVTLLMFVLGGLCLGEANSRLLGGAFVVCGLFFCAGLWQQRHASRQPLLRLTPNSLWFRNLDSELALRDIVQARVKGGRQLSITLTLREGTSLPSCHNAFGALQPKARVRHARRPQVQLSIPGLEYRGQWLDTQRLINLLLSYGAAAQAKEELLAIRILQPRW
ncbi:hypothetical protein [uncultured Pseudomonas sp.]|uniref:hypothetical protein n=1 Tax=uncultured Pseudomonas sp. TaxID=114707 RepID=UPI0025FB7C13|nr:hypothetical protein [uncultured Pseudomonas sp.]